MNKFQINNLISIERDQIENLQKQQKLAVSATVASRGTTREMYLREAKQIHDIIFLKMQRVIELCRERDALEDKVIENPNVILEKDLKEVL
jgi:hypothetical protein